MDTLPLLSQLHETDFHMKNKYKTFYKYVVLTKHIQYTKYGSYPLNGLPYYKLLEY